MSRLMIIFDNDQSNFHFVCLVVRPRGVVGRLNKKGMIAHPFFHIYKSCYQTQYPAPSSRYPLKRSLRFSVLVTFDDISDLHVVKSIDADTAIKTLFHFRCIVFEALQ